MKTLKSPRYYAGAVLLLVAIGASFILSGTKLGFFDSIPGCGVGSGCDNVTNGPWGSIPGINLPVSFIGLAWFLGLLSVFHCCVANGCTTRKFRWSVRAGVVASIGFIVVMVSVGSFCKWCALAHVCNILFWVICEFWLAKDGENSGAPKKTTLWGWWVANKDIGWYLWVRFIVLLFFVWGQGRMASARGVESDKKLFEENIKEVISGNVDQSTFKFFEGGHRIGSPDAPIQIVMFTDYQCPDCKRIEGQLASIMKTRNDVSVVVKHFPLNFECNDQIGTFKLHGNACWAARAAEAVAIVGGEEAWERMHAWLFSQEGRFTDETFSGSLIALGFNPQEIIQVMMGDETIRTVKEDCVDGKALGVYFTPMVFINGVEYLWYYGGGESLLNAIDSVAQNIKDGNSEMLAPPNASKKLVEDWRRGKIHRFPKSENLSWLGDGTLDFVVWGDYQADLTKEIDQEIKALVKNKNLNVRYTFRHFPIDESCNAGVSNMATKYDGSCALAKLVLACGALAGDSARWNMHDWILKQETPVDLGVAEEQAASLAGVDLGVIQDVVGGIDVSNQMRADIFTKNRVWRKSIPVVMIDNRYVPRWRSNEVSASELFQRIISVLEDESASSPGTSK
jgi:protein-disulfide isomerase/uncharacterized membrane protein